MEKIKVSEVIELLNKQFECEAIVLFGSYARKTERPDSDIDIALKTKKEISKQELFNATQELERIVKRDVDLIDLNNISDSFRYEILMNGKTIYCKNSIQFDLYKLDMFREYLELNESRKSIIERVKEEGTVYGKWSRYFK